MVVLSDGRGERSIDEQELIRAVVSGAVPTNGRVRDRGGSWRPVGAWYLERSALTYRPPASEAKYVAEHASKTIDEAGLVRLLGLDRAVHTMHGSFGRSADERIVLPRWGRGWDLSPVSRRSIGLPDWNPDPAGEVVESIPTTDRPLAVAAWGSPYRLPMDEEIPVPAWTGPTETSFELPPLRRMVWEREHTESADPLDLLAGMLLGPRKPGPRASRERRSSDRASRRRRELRRARRPRRSHPLEFVEMRVAPAPGPDSRRTTSGGLPGVLLRLAALALLVAGAIAAVHAALTALSRAGGLP